MKHLLTALCILLIAPFSVRAEDIVATWQYKNETTLKLAMHDENHIRMDVGQGNYMLVSGDKVYMVTDSDGQANVMDMDQLAGLMNRFGTKTTAAGDPSQDYRSTFTKAGRTETVAGYKGTVYVLETKDASGKLIDTNEVVFSKHKDVLRASKAWQAVATRMGNIIGKDHSLAMAQATDAKIADYGGILRIEEMRLTGIEKPSLKTAHFELPPGAKMTDMGALSSGGAAKDQSSGDSNFIKDLGAGAGDAAKDEVKQNTLDEVKKGVGGMFKKLFK